METSTTTTITPAHVDMKCPAPAGQTPPPHDRVTPNSSGFVPSPVECASPTSGTMYHPATPMPTAAMFHTTSTSPSPIPTFNVQHTSSHAQNSPILCGPTPTSTPIPVPSAIPHSPQPANMEFATETFSSSPAGSQTLGREGSGTHLSTIKGNLTSFVGKVTHNPDKQQAGNVMVANRKEEKAQFFEQKAAEWELKGNTAKAQKNREKAARCRQTAQARREQPLSSPVNKTPAKIDKAAKLDAKAQECERKGDQAKAVQYHEKAYQLRQKHNLSQPIGGTTTPGITAIPIAPSV